MNDRELIELAAISAGLNEHGWMADTYMHVVENTWATFDPLNDDGDAMRLAVKMHFIVGIYDGYVSVCHTMILAGEDDVPDEQIVWLHETGNDPCAAMRLAIVRAAAEVARSQKTHRT